MKIPKGRYKRLVDSQNRDASIDAAELKKKIEKKKAGDDEEDDNPDFEAEIEEAEKGAFSNKRAIEMAKPDAHFMFLGSLGAVLAGGVFPAW